MEIFSTKEDCCGCTACASICTKNAIKMAKDEEGFLYPHIDTEKCVNCGLCARVCPVKNNRVEKFTEQKAFIVRSHNEENVSASTSGGFFLPIAEWFIDQGGYVVGVCYDTNLNVVHKITNKKEELLDFRGSKYVQSNQTDTFSEIRKLLKSNKKVLYSGTPCQVAGLKQYLRGNDQNLWCIDVVCHGVPSPTLWEKYISEMRTKYESNIKDIKFRSKVMGYHTGNMEIHFENGKHYYNTARTDMMLSCFFGEISSRPSCYHCRFKNLQHVSDFTIYDCWSYSKITGKKDDDKGWTHLIVQSEKGLETFEQLKKYYEFVEADIKKGVDLDGSMIEKSAKPHPKRAEFYRDFDTETLSEHVKKYGLITKKDYAIDAVKKILFKLHILQFAKNLKG